MAESKELLSGHICQRQHDPAMPVGIFSKRDRGESATPAEWDSRQLPTPKTRIAFAAIEESRKFGSRWKAWRKRLGLADTSAITLLADGAKWIWEEQRKHLRVGSKRSAEPQLSSSS